MVAITTNIDDKVNAEASAVLATMGLTISDVIQSTLTKIAREKSYNSQPDSKADSPAIDKSAIDEKEQLRQDKLAMAGCLAEYANPSLIEQENELMSQSLTAELKDKYFAD